jgi:hypothetical protein
MSDWIEFRFWYSGSQTASQIYEYKRDKLLPALHDHKLEHFLILDEPEFMLVRTPSENGLKETFPASLLSSLEPIFLKITIESWSAIEDAKSRILSSKKKLPNQPLPDDENGWDVQGKSNQGQWLISPTDLEPEAEAFAKFMTHVAGKFTQAYISEMPSKVENRWLMSLFLHLMMDSISTWQREEQEVREFPYI